MDVQQIHHIPSTSAQNSISARTSEDPDSIVEGNRDESQGVRGISINYIDSGESYNRKTTNVNIYFATKIASELRIIQNLSPWQSASSAPTGSNGRKQSRQN
jgi:hypothetical protein